MPCLSIPYESVPPPIEPPIPVYHRRLLLRQRQGVGAEFHQYDTTTTHLDSGMFVRCGARHCKHGHPRSWRPPHRRKNKYPEGYIPRSAAVAARKDTTCHESVTKRTYNSGALQEIGYSRRELGAQEDFPLQNLYRGEPIIPPQDLEDPGPALKGKYGGCPHDSVSEQGAGDQV